jgi:membrane protein implicated in regulation of membrane protease activity
MRAKDRDAIVVAVLLLAGLAARFAWHPLGPWWSLAFAFAAALAAIAVYRFQPVRRSSDRTAPDRAQQRALQKQD